MGSSKTDFIKAFFEFDQALDHQKCQDETTKSINQDEINSKAVDKADTR